MDCGEGGWILHVLCACDLDVVTPQQCPEEICRGLHEGPDPESEAGCGGGCRHRE